MARIRPLALLSQAGRLARAMARVAWAWLTCRQVYVPPEVERARLDTCDTCPLLDMPAMRCHLCECFVEVKAMLSTEKCPINRWTEWSE